MTEREEWLKVFVAATAAGHDGGEAALTADFAIKCLRKREEIGSAEWVETESDQEKP